MIVIKPYTKSCKTLWDDFIDTSKNGTFMLKRDYVEYHADRFVDNSLMFYDDDRLVGLLCASLHGDELRSHGGLTYGGVISDKKMTAQKMLEIFETLQDYLKAQKIQRLLYKRVPAIYHSYPADEDLYALFRMGARLVRCDISTAIDLRDKIKFNERRKRNIKKALNTGLEFKQSNDYKGYVELLSEVLLARHGVKPVHTSDELIYLVQRFPQNIKLFVCYESEKMLAGVVIYETPQVAHAQYIANSQKGRECGALDLVFDRLINEIYADKRYFDFGISTENDGYVLNIGLITQKQEFGGRGIVYETLAYGGGGGTLTLIYFSFSTKITFSLFLSFYLTIFTQSRTSNEKH